MKFFNNSAPVSHIQLVYHVSFTYYDGHDYLEVLQGRLPRCSCPAQSPFKPYNEAISLQKQLQQIKQHVQSVIIVHAYVCALSQLTSDTASTVSGRHLKCSRRASIPPEIQRGVTKNSSWTWITSWKTDLFFGSGCSWVRSAQQLPRAFMQEVKSVWCLCIPHHIQPIIECITCPVVRGQLIDDNHCKQILNVLPWRWIFVTRLVNPTARFGR